MDNQRLVTFATGEKCLLTLGLINSHTEPVGLNFPITEISVSSTKFFFFFFFFFLLLQGCAISLTIFEILYNKFQSHNVPCGIGMEDPPSISITFLSHQITFFSTASRLGLK